MKIQKVEVKDFKGIKNITLDFTDEETGLGKDLIVLIGPNGSGKTSILEAIALTTNLGVTLDSTNIVKKLGINTRLISQSPPKIEIEVGLNDDEYREVNKTIPVTVKWENDQIESNIPFELKGKILYYSQDRKVDIEWIKEELILFKAVHDDIKEGRINLEEGEKDLYEELEELYGKIFYLNDGDNSFELSEMGRGEKRIMELLIHIVSGGINNSIILIDELYLYPLNQQAFIKVLPDLGENNQFIITYSETKYLNSDNIIHLNQLTQ